MIGDWKLNLHRILTCVCVCACVISLSFAPTCPVISSSHPVLLCSILRGKLPFAQHARTLVRASVVVVTTLLLLGTRLRLLYGHLPHFSAQDNPASFAESPITRGLTYSYLSYFNCKLVEQWPYNCCVCLYSFFHGLLPRLYFFSFSSSTPPTSFPAPPTSSVPVTPTSFSAHFR